MRYSQPLGVTPLGEAMDQLFRDAFTWPHVFGPSTSAGPGIGFSNGFGLNSNLYETPEGYIMQVVLPGVQVDTLQITARQNVLTVQGTAGVAAPEGGQGIWVGLGASEFREQVTLPGEVDADKASADYHDGILTLTLPKVAQARAKTITVGASPQAAIEGHKK
jgi:HSP20 family molecular chaperone IbpA